MSQKRGEENVSRREESAVSDDTEIGQDENENRPLDLG